MLRGSWRGLGAHEAVAKGKRYRRDVRPLRTTRLPKMRASVFEWGLVVLHVDVVVHRGDESSPASATAALASAAASRVQVVHRGVHLQALLFGWGSYTSELSQIAESL